MIEWEPICTNWITGRKVWVVRKAKAPGGARTWSIVAIRPNYLARSLLMCAAENIRTRRDFMELAESVSSRGFESATAERKGLIKHYSKRQGGLSVMTND